MMFQNVLLKNFTTGVYLLIDKANFSVTCEIQSSYLNTPVLEWCAFDDFENNKTILGVKFDIDFQI